MVIKNVRGTSALRRKGQMSFERTLKMLRLCNFIFWQAYFSEELTYVLENINTIPIYQLFSLSLRYNNDLLIVLYVIMSVQYKRFLKLLEKWPIDKTKSGR